MKQLIMIYNDLLTNWLNRLVCMGRNLGQTSISNSQCLTLFTQIKLNNYLPKEDTDSRLVVYWWHLRTNIYSGNHMGSQGMARV